MKTEATDVVIVGGGPAGTVLASLLTRLGQRCVVLERSRQRAVDVGTGILLQPNGLSVLYGLGLGDALARMSVAHRAIPILDERGRPIASGAMPDFGDGLDHALALLRPALQKLLWTSLAEYGGAVRFDSEVVGVDPASGTVEYRVDGERRSVAADLVVGADGIGSVVRRSGDFGTRPVTGTHRVVRAVVDGSFNVSGAEYWTALGLFGASPVGGDKTYLYASANDARVQRAVETGDLDRLVTLWSDALPSAAPALSAIADPSEILFNEVGRVRCRRWFDGRAVLVGDAAHAMAPNLGQGANSAFVDAAILARELTDHADVDRALASYDRVRRRAVNTVQRQSDLLATVSHRQGTVTRRVRDSIFRFVGRPRLVAHQIRVVQQVDPAVLQRQVRSLLDPVRPPVSRRRPA